VRKIRVFLLVAIIEDQHFEDWLLGVERRMWRKTARS
jgi:hypothetical protein